VSDRRACEDLVRTLGFDWLLMFMEEHLHSSTVTAALWLLVVLLSNQSILNRFKEGLCGGGWLDHTDAVLTNKIGTVLGEWAWPRGGGALCGVRVLCVVMWLSRSLSSLWQRFPSELAVVQCATGRAVCAPRGQGFVFFLFAFVVLF